jgi:hypothetical protein
MVREGNRVKLIGGPLLPSTVVCMVIEGLAEATAELLLPLPERCEMG